MIRILTDSTCDISQEKMIELGIESIPMVIQVDGKVYRDIEDIEPHALFDHVAETGKYPTTSAPSTEDFIKFFSHKAPAIYIGVSSRLSSTFRNAEMAVNFMSENSIDLVDSLSFSTGYGQTVIQAAKWRNDGMGYEELGKNIRNFVKRTRGIFILDTLDYLYHGGRCKAIEHFVASILKIYPFLQVLPDGTLGVLRKVRGSRVKAIKALRDHFFEQHSSFQINRIFITHLDCEDEAAYLAEEIRAISPKIEILFAKVGCVLATHSGPKPIGIAYVVV
jgi:DegV family protein with EDD domain